MGVTIKDIARETGLSVTTVSLVLNNKDSRISEKTRQLVQSTAQELNYQPNQAAVSLVTKKTQVIGLLIAQDHYYYFGDLIRSVEMACHNASYFPLISLSSLGSEVEPELISMLARRGMDGLILDPAVFQTGRSGPVSEIMRGLQIPVITLGYVDSQLLSNSITINHRQGSYLAASHLLISGHRRIACIAASLSPGIRQDYLAGYRDAMDDFGIQPEASWILEDLDAEAAAAPILDRILQEPVTAVMVSSDLLAGQLMQLAHARGIEIPRQLSFVGYGGVSALRSVSYPLTTVSLHLDRLARKAVNLIRRYAPGKDLPPELITPTLIQGGSVCRLTGASNVIQTISDSARQVL